MKLGKNRLNMVMVWKKIKPTVKNVPSPRLSLFQKSSGIHASCNRSLSYLDGLQAEKYIFIHLNEWKAVFFTLMTRQEGWRHHDETCVGFSGSDSRVRITFKAFTFNTIYLFFCYFYAKPDFICFKVMKLCSFEP